MTVTITALSGLAVDMLEPPQEPAKPTAQASPARRFQRGTVAIEALENEPAQRFRRRALAIDMLEPPQAPATTAPVAKPGLHNRQDSYALAIDNLGEPPQANGTSGTSTRLFQRGSLAIDSLDEPPQNNGTTSSGSGLHMRYALAIDSLMEPPQQSGSKLHQRG